MATECSRWSATELWNQAMSILRKKVDENDYRQYFQRIVAVSVSETELKLGVNSGFFAETIDEKFGTLISAAVTGQIDVRGLAGSSNAPDLIA